MNARDLIVSAGWFPGRNLDVLSALTAFQQAGFAVVGPAEAILAKYSNLVVRSDSAPRQELWLDGKRAAEEADRDWCAAYEARSGQVLTPVGGYSHATIYVDEAGRFWGGFDFEYGLVGDSIGEMVNGLVLEPGSRRFDHQVPR